MTHRKIAALALGLLLLLSSGCSLVDVDQEKVAEIENNKTIIEYNGTKVTKEDVTMQMTQYLSANQSSIDAIKSSGDDTWKNFKESYIKQIAVNLVALDKAKEMGLDQLTDEQKSSIDESYKSTMSMLDSVISSSVKSAVEKDPSLDYDTEYKKELKAYMNALGYDPDTYRDTLEKQTIIGLVKTSLTKDISVSDNDVLSSYNTQLKMQKNNIELSPNNFELQNQFGGTILYYPDGYMKVRHILIAFDDDTKSKALKAYSSTGDNTEYNKIIDESIPSILPKVNEVLDKMNSGEDFAKLMETYNTDATMTSDGQIVGPYSSNVIVPGYLDAVAKLTKEGSYTTLTTYSGCYIIRCDKLMAGAVPYDDVKDGMKATMLSEKQSEKWSEVTTGWIDDAEKAGTLKMYTDQYN